VEIRRFGIGHRRPEGPPGTKGVTAQVIHSDARGLVSELAFARHASIAPHSNPNTTLFVVIEGGGFVQVGEERARVAAGEAVTWPAGVVHGASTDVSEMRAIVVEFVGADDHLVRGLIEGVARRSIGPGESTAESGAAAKANGALAPRPPTRAEHDESEGEPF
jgi:quercetin dioxygenase-like cupin family protein